MGELFGYKKWFEEGRNKTYKRFRVERKFNEDTNEFSYCKIFNNSEDAEKLPNGNLYQGIISKYSSTTNSLKYKNITKKNILFKIPEDIKYFEDTKIFIKKKTDIKTNNKIANKTRKSKNIITEIEAIEYISIVNNSIEYNTLEQEFRKAKIDEENKFAMKNPDSKKYKEYGIALIVNVGKTFIKFNNMFKSMENINEFIIKFIEKNNISKENLKSRMWEKELSIFIDQMLGYEKLKYINEEFCEISNLISLITEDFKDINSNKLYMLNKYISKRCSEVLKFKLINKDEITKEDICNCLKDIFVKYLEHSQINEFNSTRKGSTAELILKGRMSKDSKHITFNNSDKENNRVGLLNKIIKDTFSNNSSLLEDTFNKVYNDYSLDVLIDKIKNNKYDENCFKLLKNHYKERFQKIYENNREDYVYNLILKNFHRYIKDELRKYVESDTIKNEFYFKNSNKDDFLKVIKQRIFKHLIYIGKISYYDIEKASPKEFQKIHAFEELQLESSNIVIELSNAFEKIVNKKDEDVFGGKTAVNDLVKNIEKSKSIKLDELELFGVVDNDGKWINKELAVDIINTIYEFRCSYMHYGKIIKKIHDFKLNKEIKENVFSCKLKIKKEINDRKILSSLNLERVFGKGRDEIKKILLLEYDKNIELPSFSNFKKDVAKEINLSEFKDIEGVENAVVFLCKKIYLNLCSKSDSLLNKNILKKYNNVGSIKELNAYLQRLSSKGNDKCKESFKKIVKDEFIAILKSNDYKGIMNNSLKECKNLNDEIYKIKCNKTYECDNKFEFLIYIIGIFCSNKEVSNFINRLKGTISWLESLEDEGEIIEEFKNAVTILSDILEIHNQIGIFKTEEISKRIKFISNKTEVDDNIIRIKEEVINEWEIIDIDNSDKIKNYIIARIDNCKEDITSFNITSFKKDIFTQIRENIGENIGKEISIKVNIFVKETETIIDINLCNSEYRNYYDQYKEIAENIVQKNALLMDVFFQASKENIIVHSSILNYIKNGDELNDNIIRKCKDDGTITKTEFEIYQSFKSHKENENRINNYISSVNKLISGKEKSAKEYLIEKYKQFSKENEFETFKEFDSMYTQFKTFRNIDNFSMMHNENSLIEIKNKIIASFSKFIYYIERDLHYIINGLIKLGLIECKIDERFSGRLCYNCKPGRYEISNKDDFNKTIKFLDSFNFRQRDLMEPGNKSKRNWIAHNYIIRNEFEKSLIEEVSELEDYMKYNSVYKNMFRNSVLGILSKYGFDFNKNLYKSNKEIKEIINIKNKKLKLKKVTCFKLESYNVDFPKQSGLKLKRKNSQLFTENIFDKIEIISGELSIEEKIVKKSIKIIEI